MKFISKLWFLSGCTAVGKTALSLKLAQLLNAEILSCDSVQVYRKADIGSAKISPELQKIVPHHGINLCDPSETFNVERYVQYAQSIIAQMQKKEKNLLVVGGTCFYLKSFFSNATDEITVPENVRNEVQLSYENFGLAELQRAIEHYGPVDLNVSDWNNPRRLLNILGRQKMTGLSQVELKQRFLQRTCPFDQFFRKVILLERNPKSLQTRIEQRVEKMLREGLIEEVKKLGNICPPLANAIGYREVKKYLDDGEKITKEKLKESIALATHQLVKKQRTWFRRQIPIHYRINLEEKYDGPNFFKQLIENENCSYGNSFLL